LHTVVGGGEGGTAREVLRHRTVEEVVMVDLDPTLVTLSMKHLPYWAGVKEDPRFELVEGDAMAVDERAWEPGGCLL